MVSSPLRIESSETVNETLFSQVNGSGSGSATVTGAVQLTTSPLSSSAVRVKVVSLVTVVLFEPLCATAPIVGVIVAVVPLRTFQFNVTEPPPTGRLFGVAVNDSQTGTGSADTVTGTSQLVLLLTPVAVRV